jgi:hypothetical protein
VVRKGARPRPTQPRIGAYPVFRISVQVMITKTIFFAKTFYTYSTGFLRQKKIFAIIGQDEVRHVAFRASIAPAVTLPGGCRRPAAPGPGPRPETGGHDTRTATTTGNPRAPAPAGRPRHSRQLDADSNYPYRFSATTVTTAPGARPLNPPPAPSANGCEPARGETDLSGSPAACRETVNEP